MKPAKFLVNFTKDGTYKFHLTRWPKESKLALGSEILDGVPATANLNANIDGKSMKFKQAYLKIGEQLHSVEVNNLDQAAIIEAQVTKGESELLAYFDLEDGGQSNAFYIYVEKDD